MPIHPTLIFVNTKEKHVEQESISFDELVKLAFETPPTGPNVGFTITYRRGPKENPEGSMVEGGSVKIKSAMVFNVTPTDKS